MKPCVTIEYTSHHYEQGPVYSDSASQDDERNGTHEGNDPSKARGTVMLAGVSVISVTKPARGRSQSSADGKN